MEVLLILGSLVVGKRCPCQRRRMAVLGRMLQSLTDDHVCEPNLIQVFETTVDEDVSMFTVVWRFL